MNFKESRDALVGKLSTDIMDQRVLKAMSRVPREKFIPPEICNQAYDDVPLPIGWQQTISQPYIIALMTAELEIGKEHRVLEIGTGSGYQTAILAELAGWVVTTERIPELAESARKRLEDLGYRNIEAHLAGEILGWNQGAPYDAILVTAGAPRVPEALVSQLKVGGSMIIPVGPRLYQELYKVTRQKEKNIVRRLGGCRFVSLVGKDAWEE
jgi:protein-L-isoaspartate(D-aspartate) O-methyltransferase